MSIIEDSIVVSKKVFHEKSRANVKCLNLGFFRTWFEQGKAVKQQIESNVQRKSVPHVITKGN